MNLRSIELHQHEKFFCFCLSICNWTGDKIIYAVLLLIVIFLLAYRRLLVIFMIQHLVHTELWTEKKECHKREPKTSDYVHIIFVCTPYYDDLAPFLVTCFSTTRGWPDVNENTALLGSNYQKLSYHIDCNSVSLVWVIIDKEDEDNKSITHIHTHNRLVYYATKHKPT